MTKDEALKLARDYIYNVDYGPYDEAPVLTAIDEALAQPAQEPVAYQCKGIPRKGCNYLTACDHVCNKCGEIHHHHQMVANFTFPPQSPWVGLTDEDVMAIVFNFDASSLSLIAKAIEAKLKEKNT